MTPCGKVTTEAAIAIVFDETAFLIAGTSALQSESTGVRITLILKYSPALSNAA